jgi:hypothetical protein
MMSGGRGGEGGWVKKCFLNLRQTALLSAEGKKKMQMDLRGSLHLFVYEKQLQIDLRGSSHLFVHEK